MTFIYKLSIALACLVYTSHLSAQENNRPNILVIMADDLGYSDLSCYGGEIPTPNLDRLAFSGLRFSRFYATPMCVTSRVAFLSGMEYQAAGGDNLPKSVSIASLMRSAGYATSMVGKNHGADRLLIGDPATDFGFDHFFGFTGGELYSFSGNGRVQWQEDGRLFAASELPEDFYTTEAFTDRAIQYMSEAMDKQQPFFSYVAFNAPHTPLQAPEANVRKFYDPENGVNVYGEGWESLRKKRLQRLKDLGLTSKNTTLSTLGIEVPDWELLPDTSDQQWVMQQAFEALTRSAFAGMVDNMDENIGRLISFLDDPNGDGDATDSQLDNTLIIFLSDNGGCYAGLHTVPGTVPWSRKDQPYTTNYGWGALSNTPFRYYKHASHEGALRTPLIVHWPEGIDLPGGTISHQMVRLWDLYPTFVDLAGDAADRRAAGLPLMGNSITPVFQNANHRTTDYYVSTFHRSKGLIVGKWKIVAYYDGPWELYNLKKDPTELSELAARKPGLVRRLQQKWEAYTKKHGFDNDPEWNRPVGSVRRGWGFDFKRAGLVATDPEFMSEVAAISDKALQLTFVGPVDFSHTEGRSIRLQKYGDPDILWSADPDETHPDQGKVTVSFTDFPDLEPNTHYYITWDAGWLRYQNGAKSVPVAPVEESAWAYRFFVR